MGVPAGRGAESENRAGIAQNCAATIRNEVQWAYGAESWKTAEAVSPVAAPSIDTMWYAKTQATKTCVACALLKKLETAAAGGEAR